MFNRSLTPTLARPFSVVNTQLPLLPGIPAKLVIHHNRSLPRVVGRTLIEIVEKGKPYGVSSSRRVLSPQLLLKRFDEVCYFLHQVLGLTTAQREVTLRLLRFWAYYGYVYPKESTICLEPGCSKATFWRTIRALCELKLIDVISRYLIRPHAQISNLYRLDKLVIMIAKYLAEHGQRFVEEWLQPYLLTPWADFWAHVDCILHPAGLSPGSCESLSNS